MRARDTHHRHDEERAEVHAVRVRRGDGDRARDGEHVRLPDPVDQVRMRSGQRRLIFATASKLGLREEQLYDLVECASEDRTRVLPQLTIDEARWVIGVLKTMERQPKRSAIGPLFAVPAAEHAPVDEELLRQAVRRGAAERRPDRCATCHARLRPSGGPSTVRTA